ncbi:MAG TPA: OmpA family protein [Polyangiaceae bacterium]|nr:OmpA family protein [Polyangiaceae bacterium]
MKRPLLSLSLLAGIGSLAPHAAAQEQPGYAASVFEPSERGSDWFANESNDYRGKFRLSLGAVGDYGYRSVIGARNPSGTIRESVLRNQVLVHAGFALIMGDRVRLGLSIPVQLHAFGHTATRGGVDYLAPVHQQSAGDVRASLDLRLAGTYGDPITLAIGASVFFPLGQREQFTGDEVVRFAPHLNIAGDAGVFAYAIRGGYEYRPLDVTYIDTHLGDTITFGGALGVRVIDERLLIGPELYGRTIIEDGPHHHDTPIEMLLGAHVKAGAGVRVNAGAGSAVDRGFGAARFRGLLGVEWFPEPDRSDLDKDGIYDDEDACPNVSGVRTSDPATNGCPPAAPRDRDRDGIIDDEDACPDTAGVRTTDPRTNGCPPPPPDRDADGIADDEDACPDVPGVHTSDPKTNGCPPDRDGDGVLDKDDACPDVAGLKTQDPKTNGCPDSDRDKDGIPNDDDACPDQAGPKSNDAKTSGCPRVFIKNGLIQIMEQPKFDFNKAAIKPDSDSLLTEVAKVMTDHPEIKRVRVEGHTDNKGAAAYNEKLSQQRADSVIKWLSSHGIAADRLVAKGMGLTTPLVPNDTEANRALNRRVEFHIEDQTETVKEMVEAPGGKTITAPPKSADQPVRPSNKQ